MTQENLTLDAVIKNLVVNGKDFTLVDHPRATIAKNTKN